MVNPHSGTGSNAGAQQAHGGPPPGGQQGGTWRSDAELASLIAQHIAAHESEAYNNLVEGLNRAGAGVRDRLTSYTQQRHKEQGSPLTNKSLQGLVRTTGNQSGRAATANLISSFQVTVGQALDSGGTDHILGHRDQDSAYGWVKLSQPLPVDTANGSVSATWRCTVDTILGPMTCYYLDNGGPDFTLLSVDQLCREGDFTYVHTRQGAYIKFPGTPLIEQLIADEGLQFIRPFDSTKGTTLEEASEHINSYYNSYSTHSKVTHPAGDTTPETLRSPISSFKHSTSIYSKRHETDKLSKETNKLSKEGGYGKPKANAATPKTVTIAKQTILPDRPDHDKPIYMGQYQWGPGTQEGSHRHPVTTANKFSALSTEDEEDTEIDETRGQPGEDRDLTLVPDGTIPTMGVVPPGVALQDPLSFPAMTTAHLQPRGFQQSEEYLQHIRSGHATKNPNCMECVLGGQQATKTPFAKATDTRMPAADGFAAACDFWGPTDPDVSGNRWHMLIVELKSKWAAYQGLPTKHSEGALKGLLHFWGQLKRLTKSEKPIISLRSDSGKEFMGAIDNHCLARGISRTTTGGYNAKKNIIVENRNKTAGERLRKCLATATGGNNYWAELTGPCMAHVIRLINIMDWSNGKNPHLAITGEKYGADKTIQPFGCMVLTYIPKEKRTSKATPVSKLGIYLGKTDDVRDGMDTADLEFDFKAQRWVIGGTRRGVVDLKAYPTVFPLRLLPPPNLSGDNTQTLEGFLESKCPWFQQGPIPIGVAVKKGKVGSGSAVYEVEKIVERRSTKSGPKYLVK